MKWIKIGGGIEIMQNPVMEKEFGTHNPQPMPARGMTFLEADTWAKRKSWRLPTEEEWLMGWGKMNHWGLLEWTTTINEEYYVLRGGSWYYLSSNLLASVRLRNLPDLRFILIGFRCVRGSQK